MVFDANRAYMGSIMASRTTNHKLELESRCEIGS